MTLKNSFDYNPFGDEISSTYGYKNVENQKYIKNLDDIDDDMNSSDRKMSKVLKIGIAFLSIVLFLTIVFSSFLIKSARDSALDSMKSMNTAMDTVSSVFKSEEIVKTLREQSGQYGGDQKAALEVATEMGKKVADDPKQLTKEMSNSEAGMAVVPYYSLCDAMKIVPLAIGGLDTARSSCETLDVSAREMMSNITTYNNMATSIAGMMTFGLVRTDTLPDVTK